MPHEISLIATIAVGLAFAFIGGFIAVRLGLLPAEGQSLIVAGALLSIGLNPLVFRAVERFHPAPV